MGQRLGGICQGDVQAGHIGVISHSGGQTTTLSWAIGQVSLGISTALHIGAEPVLGMSPAELLLHLYL